MDMLSIADGVERSSHATQNLCARIFHKSTLLWKAYANTHAENTLRSNDKNLRIILIPLLLTAPLPTPNLSPTPPSLPLPPSAMHFLRSLDPTNNPTNPTSHTPHTHTIPGQLLGNQNTAQAIILSYAAQACSTRRRAFRRFPQLCSLVAA
jgi:hypothetical protein